MKRTQSQTQMPSYEPSGSQVTIYWDEQTITRETDDGTETVYDYAYCVVPRAITYGPLVVAIIRSQYSVDDEFAAVNDGGERHAEFLAFRDQAKTLARGWTEQ